MTFHIVVIDDDPALQELYRLFLEGEGYKITLASPFAVSPAAIAALQPDLIILDIILGGKRGGWSILQALVRAPQTATLPVLLATALPTTSFEVEWKKFVQEQQIPLILKPFDIDVLLATIKSLLATPPPPFNTSYNDSGN